MKPILCLVALLALSAVASAATCGGSAMLEAPLPEAPFGAIAGSDPCILFVSLTGSHVGAVAAYRREGDHLVSLSSVPRSGFGAMALSHDGKLLIVPDRDRVMFVDTQRLITNSGDAVLATLDDDGKDADYVAVTPDDRTLFISNESSRNISVVDLAKARATGFGKDSLIGTIRVGDSPVGLAITPDGSTLFATVQALPLQDVPVTCKSETGSSRLHPQGALLAIDVERARSDPTHAAVGYALAGCNPVRVALSPAGDRAYVTARGSDALIVFDTQKIRGLATDAELARIAVGSSPVGVAVTKDGSRLFVGRSNRFAMDKTARQSLIVLAADKITAADPVLGTIAVGAFPRELSVTPDGSTLLVANALSNSLSIIDLAASAP